MLQTERQAVVAETAATESESRIESQSVVGAGRQAGGSAEVDEAVSVTLRLIDRLKRATEEACRL